MLVRVVAITSHRDAMKVDGSCEISTGIQKSVKWCRGGNPGVEQVGEAWLRMINFVDNTGGRTRS